MEINVWIMVVTVVGKGDKSIRKYIFDLLILRLDLQLSSGRRGRKFFYLNGDLDDKAELKIFNNIKDIIDRIDYLRIQLFSCG